ncbi:HAD family hydrolase [Haloarchaeobius amylolyticus]|uniref:HAD family hydrolase n=1 Tax=Haloarchaeobius amylolyticus TaxID=1198296 RepID=UPI00226F86D5|nr:HAD family hydrolase [Haloarchaeobius amylolyticus]
MSYRYRAVFVDLDDTLYAYEPCNEAGKEAALETARDLGYDFERDEFRRYYQDARSEVKRELAGTASAHERFLYFKRLIEIYTGTHKSRHALELGEAYWDNYIEEMELFDGVTETLERFHDAGVKVAIVSNLTTRIQLKKLEHLGLESEIDLVVTSEETGSEKPASVMFTLPLAQLDLRPSEAVMVGDSVEADVEGGNALGLTTVLFEAGSQADDELRGRRQPDFRTDNFADLAELVL